VQQGRWLVCCMLALQPRTAMVLAAGICQTEEVKAKAIAAEQYNAPQLRGQHCMRTVHVRAVSFSVLAAQDCQDDLCADL